LSKFGEIVGAVKTEATTRFGGFNLLGTIAGLLFLSGDSFWDRIYDLGAGAMNGVWHERIPLVPISPPPPYWADALIFLAIWIPCVAISAPEYRRLTRHED
jgi:hypothetical protein